MARVKHAPTPVRPQLHWPRRQRAVSPSVLPILVPVETRARARIDWLPIVAILVGLPASAAAVIELVIAAIRWSIPA